jgi:23S rRNA pseudouridine955/2504/2580 synthase
MAKHISFSQLIIAEDDDFIFINKPPHISSLDERNLSHTSILRMLKSYNENAQLCHRIDKETSGILLAAKHAEAYRAMAMAFEARQVEKYYHAIVKGILHANQQSIHLPVAPTKSGLAKIDMKQGKASETIITSIQLWNQFTLLECRPVSGRLHQIRIHLASQHFPIVADTDYGGEVPYLSKLKKSFRTAKFESERGMITRVALHAMRLVFTYNQELYDISAPYPKDMEVFIKLLDKHDS